MNTEHIKEFVENESREKVDFVLSKEKIDFNDFLILLSPAAEHFLDKMALMSKELTLKHFGKNIQLYIPVYLSNECNNSCAYCGFNKNNNIVRKTLTVKETENELKHVRSLGFQNILLLTGDAPQKVDLNYLVQSIKLAKKYFSFVGLEIYPMDTESYKKMIIAGASGLTVYQETYNKETYKKVHLQGKKKKFIWRLNTAERALSAGFRKLSIGVLLGLYDWRADIARLGLHANSLMKKYWKSEISISFPRLRDSRSGFKPLCNVNDKNLIQMIFALRIFLPTAGITISTRESSVVRNNLIGYGVTMMSAGSKTNPGGYHHLESESQFDIFDNRSVSEIVKVIRRKGFYPVFKDWDNNFGGVISEN